jgi:hypothetical protein
MPIDHLSAPIAQVLLGLLEQLGVDLQVNHDVAQERAQSAPLGVSGWAPVARHSGLVLADARHHGRARAARSSWRPTPASMTSFVTGLYWQTL